MDVVFLGPSLDLATARGILPADFRPPAQLGSVLAACRDGARRIGLVDGYYESVPAVWHKEIHYALASGVQVLGAASMGALRAAEMQPLGMIGVGQVFAWYRDGVITDDDEVSLMHGSADAGYPASSVPLVDIRTTLELALRQGVINQDRHDAIIAHARTLHYPDRSYPDLVGGTGGDDDETLTRWLLEHQVSQKRRDAVELLQMMAADRATEVVSPPFEQTWTWHQLAGEVADQANPNTRSTARSVRTDT